MMLVGGVLLIVIAGANSHKPTAAEIASAQAFSDKQFNQCMRGQYGGQLPPGYNSLQEYCADVTAPQTDTGLQLRDLAMLLEHTSTFVVLLGVALAASLGGADWSAGTMTTLLTWEPRRVRVLLVRAVVVALVVAFVTLLLQAILFGSLVLFEGVIAGLRPSIQDRLLVRAGGVIVSQQPIYDESRSFSSIGPSNLPPVLLGLTEAWVVAAVYVVVLMVLALLVFRARDVN